MEPIVYIVDDDDDVREQLSSSLTDAGYSVEVFSRAEPFLDLFSPTKAGCLLLDERMPGIRGSNVLERLSQWLPLFPVLLVTGYADIPLAVSAMRTGAFDVIEKPFTSKKLISRVRDAIQWSTDLWKEHGEDAANWAALQTLTKRELEVLNLVLEGHSSRTIASKLQISSRTVDNHRVHIMSKLRAKSLGDLGRAVARARATFGADGSVSRPAQVSVR